MTDISITIVAFHNEEDVKKAVCSIEEHTSKAISKKIFIVDNSDGNNGLPAFADIYPDVYYRKAPNNLGFGAGNNYILPELDSRFHAMVNPDILLTEDSLSILMGFMQQNSAVGMVIPRMVNEAGEPQAACRRELTVLDMVIRHLPGFSKRKAFHTMQNENYTKPFPVPFAQGSFLVVRTELFRELQGFDEGYFMYVEDADFCKRFWEVSAVFYCPYTTVIHKWNQASHRNGSLRRAHFRSMLYYFKKWGWKLW